LTDASLSLVAIIWDPVVVIFSDNTAVACMKINTALPVAILHVNWTSVYVQHMTRNSAIADKPRDAFVQCAMAPPHITMKLVVLGSVRTLPLWYSGVADHRNTPHPHVLLCRVCSL